MEKIAQICQKNDCTGCSACSIVCPVGAIQMSSDSEGFLRPEISDVCIACHKCIKTCPQNSKSLENGVGDFYAAVNSDKNILNKSSSGGIFYSLASHAISNNWKVCGAAFCENLKLCHIVISKKEDISKLMGSKYLQSETAVAFSEVCSLISSADTVLFVGTPCQVAGIKSLVRAKNLNAERLICVDLICHSVPSPKVFESYLKAMSCNQANEILFRDKSTGWNNYSFIAKKDGQILYKNSVSKDLFLRGFLSDILSRKSCETCKYATLKRQGDITLGDFWGISKIMPDFLAKDGASLVIANTDIGKTLINTLNKNTLQIKESDKWAALKSNTALIQSSFNTKRELFFRDWKKSPDKVLTCLTRYSKERPSRFGKILKLINFVKTRVFARLLYGPMQDKSKNVAILNLSYGNFNFGAVLVAYALQKLTLKNGFVPYILNYNPEFKNYWRPAWLRGMVAGYNFIKFRYSFLNTTRIYWSEKSLRGANAKFDTFIFGSDQVWRYAIIKENYKIYFGNFISPQKHIYSYAASFGKDKWDEASDVQTTEISKLLKNFSCISVREDSGVKICKDEFGAEAVEVLDPTLLLDAEQYAPIFNTSKINTNFDYIAVSALKNSELMEKSINFLENKYGLTMLNILCKKIDILGKPRTVYRPVSDWLMLIKKSKFIITDSFHCCVFAILFRKPFLCISNLNGGNSRLQSLFLKLGLSSKFVENENSLVEAINQTIDYNDVFLKLELYRKKSKKFLEQIFKVES